MPETIKNDAAKMPAQAQAELSNRQLEQAFALFNRVSDELGSTYRELETRVASLSAELSATHSARLRELAEKEKLALKLSALMDALPGAVVLLDRRGTVSESNPAAIEMLGQPLAGCDWIQVLQRCGAEPILTEGEFDTRDGRRLAAVRSELPGAHATIVLITDITQQHQLNQLLHREQRLRELGDVAARLAHQLRTPLSAALLYLARLDRCAPGSEDAQQVVPLMRERLGHIERLIEGMLDYIQGESRLPEPLLLEQVVQRAYTAQKARVEAAGGELHCQCGSAATEILGYADALHDALSNLIDNALLSVAGVPPVITLSLCLESGRAVIAVDDNGPGVDDAVAKRLFDPYFSTRPHGTGLGLAVVASAMQSHGGAARVDRSAAGGARFELSIPLPQAGTVAMVV